jgi:hypothetical protein
MDVTPNEASKPARSRSLTVPAGYYDVELLDAWSTAGRRYALALSPRDGGVAYVLSQSAEGVWRCACHTWRAMGTCEHTHAARRHRQQASTRT